MTAEHVLTPDDRCPCGQPQEGSGYCSYGCFSKFEMGSTVEPAAPLSDAALDAIAALDVNLADDASIDRERVCRG